MKKLRILLADDHTIMREGLKLLISSQADMSVAGEARDGEEALVQTRALRPDVVLMDLSMPNMNGLQATQAIKTSCPEVRVLILTTHEDESYLREVCRANGAGYVLKRSSTEEMLEAIRKVATGGVHLDATLARAALAAQLMQVKKSSVPQIADLSDREKEVLRIIAWGYSNKEIANHLHISVKTVETYKSRLQAKLGLHSRAEIVRYAAGQGWLSGEHAFMHVTP